MPKYHKKPVVIEAIQYNPNEKDNYEKIKDLTGLEPDIDRGHEFIEIETLEGTMIAKPGDYIIKGVTGEFYPCKPDIFEKTYEKVE